MQTFLPEYSFQESAKVLDTKRLVKQLLECRQIMTALAGVSKGWVNHPATKMWRGHEASLLEYSFAIAEEMEDRGYKYQSNFDTIVETFDTFFQGSLSSPPWQYYSDAFDKIVATHRANLFLKNPGHYPMYEVESNTYRSQVCCERCNYFWLSHTL